jgi:leucyl/phenylalanyl-tRNA---protein transferase
MRHITPEILLKAYALGVFPMAESRYDPTLYWVDPEERGVLPLDRFHTPHRIRRLVRRDQFSVKSNTAFRDVVDGCAAPASGRPSTWINDTVIDLYEQLFRMGRAHSVECWRDDQLVGGLYGVSLGAAFFGESMFSREPSASQVALVHLVARLIAGGFKLLDTQFTTEHLKRFGVINITRENYHQRLSEALREMGNFEALPESVTGETALRIVSSGSPSESRAP